MIGSQSKPFKVRMTKETKSNLIDEENVGI
jgi:hypothetical protein